MLMVMHVGKGDAEYLHMLRSLFREYHAFLGIDLCFQGFGEELAALPGKYDSAEGGGLYLATLDGEAAGCVAFYRLEEGICELKRLYVRPAFTGHGIGRALLERGISEAKQSGYHTMRLDSLRRLTRAEPLYRKFGFRDIPPYNHNPEADVYYMEREL